MKNENCDLGTSIRKRIFITHITYFQNYLSDIELSPNICKETAIHTDTVLWNISPPEKANFFVNFFFKPYHSTLRMLAQNFEFEVNASIDTFKSTTLATGLAFPTKLSDSIPPIIILKKCSVTISPFPFSLINQYLLNVTLVLKKIKSTFAESFEWSIKLMVDDWLTNLKFGNQKPTDHLVGHDDFILKIDISLGINCKTSTKACPLDIRKSFFDYVWQLQIWLLVGKHLWFPPASLYANW